MDNFLIYLILTLVHALLGFRGILYHCHFFYSSLLILMSYPLDEEGFH